MKPIKSIQFIDLFYPNIDGVVRTVDNYAARMDCAVVAPRPQTKFTDNFSYPVLRTRAVRIPFVGYGWPLPEPSLRLKRGILGQKADIYHVHSPFMLGHYALKLAKKQNIPVVSTFHSKYYDDFKRITHSEWFARFAVRYIVKFYHQVDCVWTVSQGAAQTLRDYGYLGPVEILPGGTDCRYPDAPQALRDRAFTELGLPKNKRLLLYVGQQVWQKNLKLVLDTFSELCRTSDDYRLVMAGSGYYEKQIRDYAASLDLGDRVLFTGRIADRELLNGLYLSADLFFFPSVYDTFSLVAREAAAMSLPSLLVKGSAAAEGVTDGENGYLAEESVDAMTKRIKSIFVDMVALRQAGKRARQTLPVDWSDLTVMIEEKYAEIIEKHGRK